MSEPMHQRRTRTACLLALLLAGCGGDNSDAPLASNNSSGDTPLQVALTVNTDCLLVGGITLDTGASGASLGSSTLLNAGGYLGSLDLGGSITVSGKIARDGISIGIGGSSCETDDAPEYLELLADGIPDHDTGAFPNSENPYPVIEQDLTFRVTSAPSPGETSTALTPERFDGVLNNGVPLKTRIAACASAVDCTVWHSNALHEPSWFGIDSHTGHVMDNGTYHYHGGPAALYDLEEPRLQIIGIAADGYFIFGPYFNDGGVIRKAISSYQLRSGDYPLPAEGFAGPSGAINGQFIEDYEYVAGSGDLDACNGMTVDGVYGYFASDDFPYLINCFIGTPDDSFLISSP